jgi:hypothetical protein
MTVTLIPQQLTEASDLGTEPELVEPEDEHTDVPKLAALLGQAWVAMPLFP